MTGLVIDTSSSQGVLAVVIDGVMIRCYSLEEGRSLSKTLMPQIAQLYKEYTFMYLGLGIGPGSFTGTRMGGIVAKTLSFSLNIPLVTFPSSLCSDLELLASAVNKKFILKEFSTQIDLVYFSKTP